MSDVKTDLQIAREATKKPIGEIAEGLGLNDQQWHPYGRHMAKLEWDVVNEAMNSEKKGRLVLVTAISPTPAGEGKTTTTIGLADALKQQGVKTAVCLREPSLGPCFGMKGGAAGGGYAQVVPMEEINLHFTGDFHAIGLAHNLLAAVMDNHIHQGNQLGIDTRQIMFGRVMDMNDRALRNTVIGLGGKINGVPRENYFDITVASEVMAIFCLSKSLAELRERLGRIVVARNFQGEFVTAADLGVNGAMAALLKDALLPNLVQTLEGVPAFVHGGPFANIAHGCNSLIATRTAMGLADVTVTEAGFGSDLGAEKFLDIKCRTHGLSPDAVVLVATVRALRHHGGAEDHKVPNVEAVKAGCCNLERHIKIMQSFGLPVVVGINAFLGDTDEEHQAIVACCEALGVTCVRAQHWAHGGKGAQELATAVQACFTEEGVTLDHPYAKEDGILAKIEALATKLYGASGIEPTPVVKRMAAELEKKGFGDLPVCMAKTQYIFSGDAKQRGAPSGFTLPVRQLRLSAGAGFVTAICGDIMTMPGLPKAPAALKIDIDEQGEIVGLF